MHMFQSCPAAAMVNSETTPLRWIDFTLVAFTFLSWFQAPIASLCAGTSRTAMFSKWDRFQKSSANRGIPSTPDTT
jgi:hypothetical protein